MPNYNRAFKNGLGFLLMGFLLCGDVLRAVQPQGLQSGDQVPAESSQKPAYRIPVEGLGFLPPGEIYALMRVSYATLDFLDSEHLLFTFHKTRLLPRLPDSSPDDEDQSIHAAVLDIATGKPVAQADWRMRDRSRYLWPLEPGRFLVRIRNQLNTVDKTLTLKPYLEFPGKIRAIQVGLGGHLLVTESEEERVNLQTTALPGTQSQDQNPVQGPDSQTNGADLGAPAQDVVLRIIRTDLRKQIAVAHTRTLPYIPLMKDGYLYALRGKGNHWLLGFQNLQAGEKSQIGEIESTCTPMIHPLNEQALMVVTCPSTEGKDHIAVGVSFEGKHLWEHRWSGRRIWPSFAVSQDGSHFAYETMVMNREIGVLAAADAESVIGQLVEVFDSATGRLELVAPANPILDSGQNFAFTADGRRLAVLHNNAIEIFDLPAADTAVKASKEK